ncbi:MAG: PspC domain-containing protein [Tissierellia bacterium]|nr:PspC domain-containing protein [Tissierellia bacterium]
MKKLKRSSRNKVLMGLCGGLGEYLNIDPNIIRIIWLLFGFTGFGLLVYFVSALFIPIDTDVNSNYKQRSNTWYDDEI